MRSAKTVIDHLANSGLAGAGSPGDYIHGIEIEEQISSAVIVSIEENTSELPAAHGIIPSE
jgi:hypothetical protein